MRKDTDLIGEWLGFIEKNFGFRVEFEMGRVGEKAGEPEWFRFFHRHHDGIGAFMTVLERLGMRIEDYPRLDGSKFPGPMDRTAVRLRAALLNRRIARHYGAYPWKFLHKDAGDVPCGVAWFVLSQEETSRLREFSRKKGASASTFLLWSLSRSIPRELLLDPGLPRLWRVPVNLRGPYLLNDVRANHVGSLYVETLADITLEGLHRQLRGLMEKNLHWVGILNLQKARNEDWIKAGNGSKTGRFIGIGQLSGRYGTGTFTNIGAWPGAYARFENAVADDTRAWILVPPSGMGGPIGVGVVCWNDQIGLTVNFAPKVVPGAQETIRLAGVWLREILGCLGPAKGLEGSRDPESRVHFSARSLLLAGTKILPAGSSD